MTQETPSEGAPAPRRHPAVKEAPAALTEAGEVLAALLPEVLAAFGPEMDADLDEVVCRLAPTGIARACRVLKDDPRTLMKYLRLLTVVDYVEDDGELEVVYHLYSLEHRHKMVLKARVPEEAPAIQSVTGVWRGAGWYEREMSDLFGVRFRGNPDRRALILPDDFEGFPGRRSFPLHEYDEW